MNKRLYKKSKSLLENSENKMNSFHDYKIEVPYDIPHIKVGDEKSYELEKL